MNDPFLLAHGISPAVYDISSGLRPGSIRDQIIRGTLLIDRALDAHEIGPAQSLLVVGAGVAGAAAAIEASRAGVRTTIIDRDQAFSRQYGCATRQLEPALYDWPATHWREPRFPWLGEHIPLTYPAGIASVIARRWRSRLEELSPDQLTYLPYADARLFARDHPPQYDVLVEQQRPGHPVMDHLLRTDMIVFAAGSGEERIKTGSVFRSFKFWETDTLDDFTGRSVLIAGSGDGAIQDFLRLLFKPDADAVQVLDALNIDQETIGRVQTLATHADAAFIWSGTDHHEHKSEAFIHREMHAIASKYWRAHEAHIRKVFTEYCRPNPPHFTFVHPCDHFTRSFPCNRLLALLALKWCSKNDVKLTFYANRKVNDVECQQKTHETAAQCAGTEHIVEIKTAGCPVGPAIAEAKESLPLTYDLILLRIGTIRETSPDMPLDPKVLVHRRSRQILPYHLAHLYSSVAS